MSSEQNEPHGKRRNAEVGIPVYARIIATGFFSGYSPWASGTVGSLVGMLFFFIPGFSNPVVLAIAIVAGIIAGVHTANLVATVEGDRLTKSAQRAKDRFQPDRHDTPDPSIVVIDEIVGMWIAMFAIHPSLISMAIAFIVFRVFDIIKPYPAQELERYHKGWGIMLDDVVAGMYANIATRVVIAILLSFFPQLF
jgi:phosphatidylglycerophosphatase A